MNPVFVVPAIRTTYSFADWRTAMSVAWAERRTDEPTSEALACIAAHIAVDAGAWCSARCWNVGALPAMPGEECYQLDPPVRTPAETFVVPDRFTAYATLQDGVRAHLASLLLPDLTMGLACAIVGAARSWAAELRRTNRARPTTPSSARAHDELIARHAASIRALIPQPSVDLPTVPRTPRAKMTQGGSTPPTEDA